MVTVQVSTKCSKNFCFRPPKTYVEMRCNKEGVYYGEKIEARWGFTRIHIFGEPYRESGINGIFLACRITLYRDKRNRLCVLNDVYAGVLSPTRPPTHSIHWEELGKKKKTTRRKILYVFRVYPLRIHELRHFPFCCEFVFSAASAREYFTPPL